MRASRLLCLVVLVCSCSLLNGKPKSSSSGGSSDGDAEEHKQTTVASEKGGSHVVTFYNQGHRALASGDEAAEAKDYEAAGWHYLEAKKAAADARAFVKDKKDSGDWTKGLHYKTKFDDDELTEKQFLAALDDLATKVDEKWEALAPKAHQAWKKPYGATTDEAFAKLEELGKPTRTKADKKGTCWFYELDDSDQTWCWTKKGKLGKHEVKPKQVAESGGDDAGGDGGGGGGESQPANTGPVDVSFDLVNECDRNVRTFVGGGKPGSANGTHSSANDGSTQMYHERVGTQVWIEDDSQHGVVGATVEANTHKIVIGRDCASISAE